MKHFIRSAFMEIDCKTFILIDFCLRTVHERTILTSVTQTVKAERATPDSKAIMIKVPPKMHKKLKVLAATQETTLQNILMSAVER